MKCNETEAVRNDLIEEFLFFCVLTGSPHDGIRNATDNLQVSMASNLYSGWSKTNKVTTRVTRKQVLRKAPSRFETVKSPVVPALLHSFTNIFLTVSALNARKLDKNYSCGWADSALMVVARVCSDG